MIATLYMAILTGSDDRERSRGSRFHGADEGHHQETKWKGSKAKELGHSLKIFYTGSDGRRNGVCVILNDEMNRGVLAVERMSDRIWIKVDLN